MLNKALLYPIARIRGDFIFNIPDQTHVLRGLRRMGWSWSPSWCCTRRYQAGLQIIHGER